MHQSGPRQALRQKTYTGAALLPINPLYGRYPGIMKQKWLYWISTVLLCAMYLMGVVYYAFNMAEVQKGYVDMSYPAYLPPIMLVVKLAGVVAILGRFSVAVSDLAYAGMFFHLCLAFAAHIGSGIGSPIGAVIGMLLLVASFLTQNHARRKKSPYGGGAKA